MQHSALEIGADSCQKALGLWEPVKRGVVVTMSQKKRKSTSLLKPFTHLNMNYSYLGGQTMYSDSHTLSWIKTTKGDKYLISFILTFLR